jgi:single-stranded DNA-binding protein
MAQMTWTAKKMTLVNEPETIVTKSGTAMVKVKVVHDVMRKNGNEWVKQQENHFEFIAFGDIATQLSMYGSGEMLDFEGAITQRIYETKWRKENRQTQYVINSFNVSEE